MTSRRNAPRPPRVAAVLAHWEAGMPTAQILEIVNALPGTPADAAYVRNIAARHGLSRPGETRGPREAPARKEWMDAGPNVPTAFTEVAAWAAANGLRFTCWDDLPAVNEARERQCLHGFAYSRSRGDRK